ENMCRSLMKDICTAVGIDINNRDIVNYSEQSIPIIFLFQNRVPTATTMSLTGHRSKLSYYIYTQLSDQQREDALLLLINNVGLVPLNSSE
ncbi:13685_t:CDS:1, partial [Racocetra persica]